MKKIILVVIAIALMAGCKQPKNDGHNHEDVHQHEKKDNHNDHNHDGHDHDHNHDHDKEHNHDHDKDHNHDHDKDHEHDHDKDHDHDGHDHTGTHNHDADGAHGKDAGEHNHAENEIHLTAEQLKSAKIKIGSIEKRKMRERIEVTGSIEAPPQSKATIHAPLEGFVHKADLLLGDKVKKGQTIAVLKHPNFTKLQYNFLESLNKLKVTEQEFKRKEKLFKSDISSEKLYQLAESNYQSAKNSVQNYRSQLKMAGLSPEKIQKEGIQQYVYVKSPISGYIVKNNLNQGKFLSANVGIHCEE